MRLNILGAAALICGLAGCASEEPMQSSMKGMTSPSQQNTILGYNAYKAGDLLGAESAYLSALSIDPTDAYALNGLGAVRELQGDYVGAADLYRAAETSGVGVTASYAYITSQRMEKSTNGSVSDWAANNLRRLMAEPAYLAATGGGYGGQQFASLQPADAYIQPASYSQPVDSYVAPMDSYVAPVETYAPPMNTYGLEQGDIVSIDVYHGDAPTHSQGAASTGYFEAATTSAVSYGGSSGAMPVPGTSYQPVGDYESAIQNLGAASGVEISPISYDSSAVTAPVGSYEAQLLGGGVDPVFGPASQSYESAQIGGQYVADYSGAF